MTGEFTVDAVDLFDAEVKAHCLVGDQQATLSYIPSEDIIDIQVKQAHRKSIAPIQL